jgi:hypothetical protein
LTSVGTPSHPGAREATSAWMEPATWEWVMVKTVPDVGNPDRG